jgi:hypothetical protein
LIAWDTEWYKLTFCWDAHDGAPAALRIPQASGATSHRQFPVTFTRSLSFIDHADGLDAEVQP